MDINGFEQKSPVYALYIQIEGTMSQNVGLGPGSYFMTKKR